MSDPAPAPPLSTESPFPEDGATLLRDHVPEILAETRRLGRAHAHGTASALDLHVNDARVRTLLVALARAHATTGPGALPPTGARTREITVMAETAGEGIVARAPMAFCPESALIVHAPIMLGRVLALAERILPAKVTPRAFRDVRLRRPVTTDLILRLGASASASDNGAGAPLSGTVEGSDGSLWPFTGHPVEEDGTITRWVDNREVPETFAITADPSNPVRAFQVATRPNAPATAGLPEAVQRLLEAVIRAVVIHRNRDGRGILLGAIPRFAWPEDIQATLARPGATAIAAHPGGRHSPRSPWHILDLAISGSLCEGEMRMVEARTTLTALFR